MRFNRLFLFGLILTGLIVHVSCRKMDRLSNQQTPQDLTTKFFNDHPSSDLQVQALADMIKRENEQSSFVSKVVQAVGYPRWNKALSYSPKGSSSRTGTNNNLNFYFIPFVRDSQQVVNTCLIIKTLGTDTSYKWLCDWNYKDSVYNGLTRRGTAVLMMRIDQEVFGQGRKYLVTDTNLIDSRTSPVTISGAAILGTSADNRSATVEVCYTYQAPVNGWNTGCPPGDENCTPYQTVTLCTTYTLQDNIGGSNDINNGTGWVNTSSGGGGGSTAGWTQPPSNPCVLFSSGGREPELPPGCTEPYAPGWVPSTVDVFYPAEYLTFPYVSPADQAIIDNWKALKIKTSGLDSCRKIMLAKMLSNTHAMGRLLTKLDKALNDSTKLGSFNIEYRITTDIPPQYAAFADSMVYDPFDRQFYAIIKINPTFVQNSTDIYLSQSILHETVHAYLSFILKRIMAGASYAQIQYLGYPKIFDTYVDSLKGRNYGYLAGLDTSAQFQHNYMANHLLEFFANALSEFDDNRINDDEFYWYMGWKGLQPSKPWTDHWPNYPVWPISPSIAPATDDQDKEGFKYALTSDRLADIHNSIWYEQISDSAHARGRRRATLPNCYQ